MSLSGCLHALYIYVALLHLRVWPLRFLAPLLFLHLFTPVLEHARDRLARPLRVPVLQERFIVEATFQVLF